MNKQEVIENIKEILKNMEHQKTERKINKILTDDIYLDKEYGWKRTDQNRINKLIEQLKQWEQEDAEWIDSKTFIFKKQTKEGIYIFNVTPDEHKKKMQYQVDIKNNTYYWTRHTEEKL